MARNSRTEACSQSLAVTIGRNTLLGVIANVVQVCARLVTVPIVIQYLGLEGYGIWSVLMSIAAYMSLGGAGVKSAFQKYAAEATGSGDYDRACKLITTGTVLILLISTTLLIPVALFSSELATSVGVPLRFAESAGRAIWVLAFMAIPMNVGQSYQAILMGAHRIDLQRKLAISTVLAQSILTILLLRFGFGLVAMAVVFGSTEIGNSICCLVLSRRIVPAIQLAPRHLSKAVLRDLTTFGGSYQLVSILEALYTAILPVAILKFYGASEAGILALANRVVAAASLPQGALLQPLLTGGSFVYASSSSETMRLFFIKAFKAMLAISLTPLAFVACFGSMIVLVWTGQSAPTLRPILWLLCLSGLFRSFSSLTRVFYRVSGRSVMDNVQLLSMLVILACVCTLGQQIAPIGMIAGAVLAQLVGMVLIWLTFTAISPGLAMRNLMPEFLRFAIATAGILASAAMAVLIFTPLDRGPRSQAGIQLGVALLVGLAVTGPALLLTRSVSRSEVRIVVNTLRGMGGTRVSPYPNGQTVPSPL